LPTKTFPASDVDHAISAGMTDAGENKVQEARDKKPSVTGSARWHLIGHLQSNKAKDAVRLFDVIQTIDSIELAERVARIAESEGKQQEVLVQGERRRRNAEERRGDRGRPHARDPSPTFRRCACRD
jgi:uncharacterized pyridoxal phosphate-containing UPF0001 family protein